MMTWITSYVQLQIALQHQSTTSSNIELSSKVIYGIHLWVISQKVPISFIRNKCSMIILLNL